MEDKIIKILNYKDIDNKKESVILRKTIITKEVIEIVIPYKDYIKQTEKENPYEIIRFILPPRDIESHLSLKINDSDEKNNLAKLFDICSIPNKDVSSFDELDGLFDDVEYEDGMNGVETLKYIARKKMWRE